jgi:glyoxalase family protein
MQLTGIHHLTAVTGNAPANRAFCTKTLCLGMVKKTIKQDHVSAYHLFYADGRGSPGSNITCFKWPVTQPLARPAQPKAFAAHQQVNRPSAGN